MNGKRFNYKLWNITSEYERDDDKENEDDDDEEEIISLKVHTYRNGSKYAGFW